MTWRGNHVQGGPHVEIMYLVIFVFNQMRGKMRV